MRAYRDTGAHRHAMPALGRWCDGAWFAHWQQPTKDLPDWAEVHRHMCSSGKPANRPIPKPVVLPFSEVPIQPGRPFGTQLLSALLRL